VSIDKLVELDFVLFMDMFGTLMDFLVEVLNGFEDIPGDAALATGAFAVFLVVVNGTAGV